MDAFKSLLGARIKLLRKQTGMKQAELAEACGVEANTISRYERGINSPSIEQLLKISQSLNISPIEILSSDALPNTQKFSESEIWSKIRQASTKSSYDDELSDYNKMFIGNKIRSVRISSGISQIELGRLAGLGDSTISKYETGINVPELEHLLKISEVLKVSPLDILPPQDLESQYKNLLCQKIIDRLETNIKLENLEKIFELVSGEQ